MRIALIVSTYNRPDALDLVLYSVYNQSRLPDEIIVADDGSSDDTRQLVEKWTDKLPIRSVWHEDAGFRLAEIRNRALKLAHAEYIIVIDGDIVLHPLFVRDHEKNARQGHWVQGSRVMVGPQRTVQWLNNHEAAFPTFVSEGIQNRLNAIRSSFLSKIVSNKSRRSDDVRGAHMAFWKGDILSVDGYDARYRGWGREDNDLAARLLNAGVQRINLKLLATCFHLHHDSSAGDTSRADAMLEEVRSSGLTQAVIGISDLS